ncbi:hypothetical protein GCM10022224_016690 [Nonomuraea antimicrobica]|uniref:Uncharacterized protein n=1 Tax=Nonomuraea antimicrobica TaxID=561173 RepID=A0ABP7BA67_9ACTN
MSGEEKVQAGQGSRITVELIDVLMRGLETARSNALVAGEETSLFCGVAYSNGPVSCPVSYWHSDTGTGEVCPWLYTHA